MLFEKIQLESEEEILKIVHKHWYVVFRKSVGIALTALLPLIGWIAAGSLIPQTFNTTLDLAPYTPHFAFLYSAWLLCNWMLFAYIYTDHHLDVWIITDRRIVSIDQQGLFRRSIGSFRLEKLQDVNISINGIIATFLHFGTVEAQTASGSEEEFRSHNLPHPRDLKSIILNAADTRMNEQNTRQQQTT